MRFFVMPFLLVLLLAPVVRAELRVASLFTDQMVLQRDQEVPVWGWADEGTDIRVDFGGQTKKARAGAGGKWRVDLDSLEGSFEGRSFKVMCSSGEEIVLKDVVVGEVWICSGQSNMQFSHKSVAELKPLVPKAKQIRTFAVERTVAFEEQEECKGKWVEQVPDSAVGFGFAYYLQERVKVPVGIILLL